MWLVENPVDYLFAIAHYCETLITKSAISHNRFPQVLNATV